MKPAIRTQIDDLAETVSIETGTDCSDLPDLARQEFKDESDPNLILQKFGVPAQMNKPYYTSIDYDSDLQQSLIAIDTAQAAIRKLPEPLRKKYYHWEILLQGLYSGQFKNDLDEYKQKENAQKDFTNKEEPVILQEPSKKE